MKWSELKIGMDRAGLANLMIRMDRSSAAILGIVWLAVIFVLVIASYNVHSLNLIRQQIIEIESSEMPFFDIHRAPVTGKALADLKVSLLKRYPSLTISVGNNNRIRIATTDPNLFKPWLLAISSVETVAPHFDWEVKYFCVGPECKGGLMAAELSGTSVTFSANDHALDENKSQPAAKTP